MAFKKAGKSKFGAGRPFNRDSDRPRFDKPRPGGRSFGNRSFGKPSGGFELFDLKCDKCGKDCQVPFKPTSGKPVYCRDCFKNDDKPKKSFKSDRDSSSDELAQINEKLDKIMRALKID